LAGWLLLGSVPSEAQAPVRHVLLLQSFYRGNLIVDSFTDDLRVELDQRAGTPVSVFQVVVGSIGLGVGPERVVLDYIRSTFGDFTTG
jgi:hypothetical protein